MKIVFDRELLISKLKLAAAFIPKKAIIPAHSFVLFEVNGNIVKLTAQNGEMQIINSCTVMKSDGDGKFTLPGKLLLQTISLMKEPEVTITFKNDKCDIKSGKSKYKLSATDGADYPLMPRVKADFECSFTGSAINTAIETSLNFASKENPNIAFQGVCMRGYDTSIGFLSCNAHTVSKVIVAPRSINNWNDIIVPEETCKAIVKCVNDIDIVDVLHNKKTVEISAGEVVIISSVLDTRFPAVEEFYKKKPSKSININTLEFAHAVERLALVASEETPMLSMQVSTDGITMSTVDENYGNSGEEHVTVVSEEEILIKLSFPMFQKILDSFDNDMFTMSFDEFNKPVFFDPIDNVNGNNKHFLIAPMI